MSSLVSGPDEVVDSSAAWDSGASPLTDSPKDVIKGALQKEEQIRDIVSLQESLRSLLTRISKTEDSTKKLQTENEMLKMYVENLTKSNATTGGGTAMGIQTRR